MSAITPDQQNVVLDKILAERRSHRQFKQEFPPEEYIRIYKGNHPRRASGSCPENR